MAIVDKFNVGGVLYDVRDTETSRTVSEQGKTINQQGQTIARQGQTITKQGEEIARLAAEIATGGDLAKEQPIPVTRYGAVGDSSTDCSDAFDTAVNTGNEIFVPAGTYIISRPILLKDGQTLRGQGPGCTIIKASASFTGKYLVSTKKFEAINNVDNGDEKAGFNTIEDIGIDGSAWTPYYKPLETADNIAPANTAHGLAIAGSGFFVNNVKIWNCGSSAIYFNKRQSHNYNIPMNAVSKFSNIDIGICGYHAIEISGVNNTDTQWVNVHCANGSALSNNTNHDLYIHDGANAKFTNCHFAAQYGHKKPAFAVFIDDGSNGSVFENCDIEGAFRSNLFVGSSGNTFNNCRFYAFFGNGCNINLGNKASNNTFTGCSFLPAARDDIYQGKLTGEIITDGGGSPGSNHHNAFIGCIAENSTIAYFSSQWANTIVEMRCTAPTSSLIFESQESNRALITGGSNQKINW